jgi:glycosyltransferase involved in cell wall biosynthesis
MAMVVRRTVVSAVLGPAMIEPSAQRVDVLIIARNNLQRDARVLKEAVSLTEVGYRVTRLGIVTGAGDALEEATPFGPLVRVLTSMRPLRPGDQEASDEWVSQGANAYAGLRGDLRHWLGRIRENWLLYKRAAPLHPHVVISCDLDTLLTGALLKLRRRSRLVYDSHELWVEQSATSSRLYKALFSALERVLIRYADSCITVNDRIGEELSRRYHVSGIRTVYNGSTECSDAPMPVRTPMRFLYQGIMSGDRGLEGLVTAMDALRGRAVLSVQGFGPLQPSLQQLVDEHGLADVVRFLPPVAPDQVVQAASGHDIGVMPYRPTSMNNYLASPNKLFDYLGAGLAVLGSRIPVVEDVVEKNHCGLLFAPFDEAELVRQMTWLVEHPGEVTVMKGNAVSTCPRYAWQAQVAVLLEVVGPAAAVVP